MPAGERSRAHRLAPWGVGLAAGALALGPVLGPGIALRYDMVFAPDAPLSAVTLGAGGGFPRAVPSDAVVAALGRVLPADLVQALVLLAVFALAAAGAARLVPGRGALPGLAAALFYVWNPYLAERLLLGQWAVLLGYAGLPWVLCAAVRLERVRDLPRLVVALVPAAVGGFSSVVLSAVVAGAAAAARPWRRALAALSSVAAGLAAVSLPWLVPALGSGARTDPAAVELFAARADTPFGAVGSLLSLGGIWNAQAVPAGYDQPFSAACRLLLSLGALAGWVWLLRRGPRPAYGRGLSLAAAAGFAIALLGTVGPGRALLAALIGAWPGFGPLRDGQLYVAPLALLQAIGFAAAVLWLRGPAGGGQGEACALPSTPGDHESRFQDGLARPPRFARGWTRTHSAAEGSKVLAPQGNMRAGGRFPRVAEDPWTGVARHWRTSRPPLPRAGRGRKRAYSRGGEAWGLDTPGGHARGTSSARTGTAGSARWPGWRCAVGVLGRGPRLLWSMFRALGGRGRRARWPASSPRTETMVAPWHTRWRRALRGTSAIPSGAFGHARGSPGRRGSLLRPGFKPSVAEDSGHGGERAGAVAAVLLLFVPLVLLPGLAWGAAGRLVPLSYPQEWLRVRQAVAADPAPGAVLSLPWSAYRGLDWSGDGRTVVALDPAVKLFDRRVVWNDDLRVETGGQVRVIEGEDPLAREVAPLLAPDRPPGEGPGLAAALGELGIRYVLIQREAIGDPHDENRFSLELADADVVRDGPRLLLLRIPDHHVEAGIARLSGLEVTGWLATVGAIIWSITASGSSLVSMRPPRRSGAVPRKEST
ncbi:hypothetical protein HDA32_004707 [Spinactinospora alkalitolerans]|uniref:Membrane protein 6-pyruvoyl-tetrahydropterin synthase-related domain-containing protein n=1 Tax=Spinactinospora alkalitolerans TaxID=687207 RepID=A0A852U1X2_9ACTN|nr:hypothetical protein [Spinactinospora alkalitolerans]NYE49587.1 hypothetical protein [Spinactinospora alkalitolerans]